ncbi:hypothetical protein SSPIM334S_04680 [Streptomyces spiroverticillatus]
MHAPAPGVQLIEGDREPVGGLAESGALPVSEGEQGVAHGGVGIVAGIFGGVCCGEPGVSGRPVKKKTAALRRTPIVFTCSVARLRSRSSSSRSAVVSSPGALSPRSALARWYQTREDSELMPSSQATAVTVLPDDPTSAIASLLNSAVHRFVYVIRTWRHFLWNIRSQSPDVHDQGEGSMPAFPACANKEMLRISSKQRGAAHPVELTHPWEAPCVNRAVAAADEAVALRVLPLRAVVTASPCRSRWLTAAMWHWSACSPGGTASAGSPR